MSGSVIRDRSAAASRGGVEAEPDLRSPARPRTSPSSARSWRTTRPGDGERQVVDVAMERRVVPELVDPERRRQRSSAMRRPHRPDHVGPMPLAGTRCDGVRRAPPGRTRRSRWPPAASDRRTRAARWSGDGRERGGRSPTRRATRPRSFAAGGFIRAAAPRPAGHAGTVSRTRRLPAETPRRRRVPIGPEPVERRGDRPRRRVAYQPRLPVLDELERSAAVGEGHDGPRGREPLDRDVAEVLVVRAEVHAERAAVELVQSFVWTRRSPGEPGPGVRARWIWSRSDALVGTASDQHELDRRLDVSHRVDRERLVASEISSRLG